MGTDIRIRLLQIHKTQRELVRALKKSGFSTLYEPKFTRILDGDKYTDSDAILQAADKIVTRWEQT